MKNDFIQKKSFEFGIFAKTGDNSNVNRLNSLLAHDDLVDKKEEKEEDYDIRKEITPIRGAKLEENLCATTQTRNLLPQSLTSVRPSSVQDLNASNSQFKIN